MTLFAPITPARACVLVCAAAAVAAGLVLQSCDKEQTVSGIHGTVSVQGTDADSVVVRLYERPDVTADVEPWSVTAREPGVGFTYESPRAFDYRMSWEVATRTTDAQGNFSFDDLAAGDYIIVADGLTPNGGGTHYKEAYGWSTPKDIHVDGSEQNIGTLQLYPDTVLGREFISEEIVVPAGRHWVLSENIFILDGGKLVLEPGAVLRIRNQRNVYVNEGGEFVCDGTPDNYITITADDIFARDAAEWTALRFNEGALPPRFRYCRIEHGLDGVATYTDGGYIENCYYNRCTEAMRANNAAPPAFRRNVVHIAGVAVHCGSLDNFVVEHNLFQTCRSFSLEFDTVNDGIVFCNWFRDGGGSDTSGSSVKGVIRLDWVGRTEIHQNSFETSWYALAVGSRVDSSVYIHHNTFHRIHTIMDIGVTEDRRVASFPTYTYNCMSVVDFWYARVRACNHNTHDIDAQYNYWNGNVSPESIHTHMIYDCFQEAGCPCFLLDPLMPTCGEIESLTGTEPGVCGG